MPIMLGGGSGENLSRCYLGDQLLVGGNCEIVEQFDMKTIGTRYNMYKQGYSIKSIQVQESQYCGYNSTRGKGCITFVEKQNTNLRLSIMGQVGTQWGYDYHEQTRYGGVGMKNNGSSYGFEFSSSSNNKNYCAWDITLTRDKIIYNVGTTYGTWLWSGEYTLNSNQKYIIETVFDSAEAYMVNDSGVSSGSVQIYNMDVFITYS